MLFDSDVLVWYFRQNPAAQQLVRATAPFRISAITYMELMQGALNKQDMAHMDALLRALHTTVLPVTEAITYRAMTYVKAYALSNSVELADALIAATAVEHGERLYTANDKHYKCIPDLQMNIFRPN